MYREKSYIRHGKNIQQSGIQDESEDAKYHSVQRTPSLTMTRLPSYKSRINSVKRSSSYKQRGSTLKKRRSTRIHDDADFVTAITVPIQSENTITEDDMIEKIMKIREMPVHLSKKKLMKQELQSMLNASTMRRLRRSRILQRGAEIWNMAYKTMKEAFPNFELYASSLKAIGGNFGMGVVTYFLFIKWLLLLNVILAVIVTSFLFVPVYMTVEQNITETCENKSEKIYVCCSQNYSATQYQNLSEPIVWLHSNTYAFYGLYSNRTFKSDLNLTYDIPLAYMCVTIALFVVSLLAIITTIGRKIKESVLEDRGEFHKYCNIVFGGWDFCINNYESAINKHKALYNEMRGLLESDKYKEEISNRTRKERIKLLIIRVFVNIVVISLIAGVAASIYYVRIRCREAESMIERNKSNLTHFIKWILSSVPSMYITISLVFPPILFDFLITLERYNPVLVVRLTLFRTVLVRFIPLVVILIDYYKQITVEVGETECTDKNNERPICWEDYIGQDLLKMYCVDIALQFFFMIVNFFRAYAGRRGRDRLIRFIGEQKFDIPSNALDVVYLQTIVWMGMFFMPILPVVAILGFVALFYIKKFSCLINSTPSGTVYRVSKSNSSFMVALLMFYVIAVVPVTYSILVIRPSKSCGPFRDLNVSWNIFDRFLATWPSWISSAIYFINSSGFGIPIFITFALLSYYYYAVSIANDNLVAELKKELVLNGHDKQFLQQRLNIILSEREHSEYVNQFYKLDVGKIGTFN